MEYWILWFIGIAITIVTSIIIHGELRVNKAVLYLLVILSISIVGGIANGKWIGSFESADIKAGWLSYFGVTIMILLPAILTYFVGYQILGLDYFESSVAQIVFVVVFVTSVVGWSISIWEYNSNIEVITQNVATQKEEKQLLYFCNIPVQKVSGDVSGSAVLGTGKISGDISTSDELPYWYLNDNSEGEYDSALAANSKIVFIEDQEEPYIEIIKYCKQTTTKNHNNGKVNVKSDSDNEWYEYRFYVPKDIMKYNLG